MANNIKSKDIKSVILAAGKGTRMKSVFPKVLFEIFSKPLLGWVIDSISSLQDLKENIVVIGNGAQLVSEYLNKNYKNASTVLQEKQLGTGHAVSMAMDKLKGFEGNVLIVCGDTPLIQKETLEKFVQYHNENKAALTVMTAFFDNPFGYGRIIRNEDNNVVDIVEQKDATDIQKAIKEVNTGIYLLDWDKIKEAFSKLQNNNAQGEYYLTDIVKWSFNQGFKTLGFSIEDNSETFGINSRSNLATASKIMKDRYLEKLMENGVTIVDPSTTFISPDTTIDCDTTIFPNTFINGKNTIAKFCKIGPFTHIRGNCEVGEGCKIGNFVELKNAKIAKKTNVCHLTYMGDAIVGSNVNIGAGTIFANYNSITKEKKTSKLADGVSIGSNTVLVAPVELGENAFVAASSCITKDVEKESLAMTRSPQKELKNWVKMKKGEN